VRVEPLSLPDVESCRPHFVSTLIAVQGLANGCKSIVVVSKMRGAPRHARVFRVTANERQERLLILEKARFPSLGGLGLSRHRTIALRIGIEIKVVNLGPLEPL
jgi:hypothetical protein